MAALNRPTKTKTKKYSTVARRAVSTYPPPMRCPMRVDSATLMEKGMCQTTTIAVVWETVSDLAQENGV